MIISVHFPPFIFQGTPLASDLDAFTGFVNATKKTKVIVHGFLDNGHDNWVTYAKDELLVKVKKCTYDFFFVFSAFLPRNSVFALN